jgi:hypothetical protein
MRILTVLVTASMLLATLAIAEPAKQVSGKTDAKGQVARPAKSQATGLVMNRIPAAAVRSAERDTWLSRRKNALQAEAIFRKAGVTNDKAIVALMSNAWHECRWDPREVTGPNVGFFQLNHSGGLGRGHRVSQLKKLDYNVAAIMVTTDFKNWAAWVRKNPNATSGQMAYRFAQKVERCTSRSWGPRASTANRWYAAIVNNKGST